MKKTFREFASELTEFKLVSKAARKKMAMRMRRQAQTSAFKLKVAKAKLKVAPPEKLLMKARRDVGSALKSKDSDAERKARNRVHKYKKLLGER